MNRDETQVENERLKSALADQQRLLDEKDQVIRQLEHQVRVFKKMVFGPRSEKHQPDAESVGPGEGPQQGNLFHADLLRDAQAVADEHGGKGTIEEVRAASAPKKKGKGRRKRFPPHLPVVRTTYELGDDQRACPGCSHGLHESGVETTRELERVELTLVHEIARTKYACRHCAEVVVTAPGPDRVIPKGLLGRGFLAHVIVERFDHHMPYHRLEKKYASEGLDLSRTVLYQSVHRCAEKLKPIWEQLRREVLESEVIHTDDTPVVIAKAGPEGRKLGRFWVYLDRDGDHYFDFTRSRSRDGPQEILGDHRGYVQADAYGGYDQLFLPGGATEVGCWAHARRKIRDARNDDPELADELLRRIGELYAVEKEAREKDLAPDAIRALRQERSRPRLESLHAKLELARDQVLPKSALGQAISYALNQWQALTTYTENGILSIDNNRAENALRPIAVGRKNWEFVGNEAGGEVAAIHMSLVHTAKAYGLNPKEYLRDVLIRIDHCDDVAKLSPRGWKEHFLPEVKRRREEWLPSVTDAAIA